MKRTLTYCFYQENAAEAELDFWEKSNDHRIISKTEHQLRDKMIRVYEIANIEKNENELMLCIPENIQQGVDPFLKNEVNVKFPNREYKKTLFFGKLTKEFAYCAYMYFLS